MGANETPAQKGRLYRPPGFAPKQLLGLWTRKQREYFVTSLVIQPNDDRNRAEALLARMKSAERPEAPT